MLYTKALKRIDRCIDTLEKRRLTPVEFSSLWETADLPDPLNEGGIPSSAVFTPVSDFPFYWGKPWINTLFSSDVSYEKKEGEEYYLELRTETDTLVYINSKPEGAVNPFHPLFRITPYEGQFSLLLEAWGGHFFPGYHPGEGGRVLTAVAERKKSYPLIFSKPRLLKKNENLWKLYFDARVLRGLIATLDESSLLCQTVTDTLHRALITLDYASSDEVLEAQAEKACMMLRPVLDAHNGTIAPQILSIGNAHLDHAWLWPVSETERKAARTTCQMMKYMDEFPEFPFTFTQPVQMKAVRDRYPSIFEKMKRYEAEGRFEVQGISWVEPDCMLPSGESFVRQFIYGRKTVKELFSCVKGTVFWVPDSFGYNAQLPQILKGSGIEYFVTSKIGWNDTNAFPYDLFIWEGLDGTRIPSHMIIDAYEGKNEPEQIMHVWNKIRHKDLQSTLMRSIGEGDGGGGTMLEDIEMIKRMGNLQGLPKNRWTTLQNAMEEIFSGSAELPVYKGELYLELHRGTYTVQAEVKKGNRALEKALSDAEFFVSSAFASEGMSERVSEALSLLEGAWEVLLTNQFHDILPGSCIGCAMKEAVESYKKALDDTEKALDLVNGDVLCQDVRFSSEVRKFEGAVRYGRGVIYTPWGDVTPDGKGGLSSVHAFGRELVRTGGLFNKVTFSPDETVNWDAWDMEADMIPLRKRVNDPEKCEVEIFPDRAEIVTETRLSDTSSMMQKTVVRAALPVIDFYTSVDWNEEHKILRSEFDTSIVSPYAEYSVPFGHISRSTGDSTSSERAQFEVPSGLFTHFGDTQNSVILTSDSKYGYRVKGSTMSISLLRSPKAPDPEADIGHHDFVYSLHFAPGG
ncbi:MAG: alpha-mannosidase, partial [Bullifex sp.]